MKFQYRSKVRTWGFGPQDYSSSLYTGAMRNEYQIRAEVSKIVEDNCEEIPYEGTEVNKSNMKMEIMNLISTIISEVQEEK